ncbi:MAG TPA: sn-glycerol-1-phosphate dehydrogenase [Candidatus Paceibacterota bacterium]|nr:sn-glycerol-1-phosphate dehydrogenase [Verrucomicrobiota bacterium]HRY46748.1 sn-glycerol-1-phosphate dehydrogenase [Candidatus Paceibacterota bacterium]
MSHITQALSLSEALRASLETRDLKIGEQILEQTPRVFREQFGDRPAVVIADPNTYAAAGGAVQETFRAARFLTRDPFIFGNPGLSAEHRFVLELESFLQGHEAIPVVVGSGTLNDLTKLAAHRTGRPYLCVATAASMDGYAAFGASITHEGSKQTFPCPAPRAVVADLSVIRRAPVQMAAWGYADLLAKIAAGADWMLADALGIESIHPLAWNLVQGRLREAVGDPAGVRTHEPAALGRLIEGLMLGGFAMQAAQSSRPASGAEHQFSHLWDMQHHTHQGRAPSHGLKVGIGLLAVTALYEWLLNQPLDQLDVKTCAAAWREQSDWIQDASERLSDDALKAVAIREISAKHISAEQLRQHMHRLGKVWPDLTNGLRQQLIPIPEMREMLRTAGAATEPEQIGISRNRLRDSYWQAFFIRRRFTILDLAVHTDLLDRFLNDTFSPGGLWPIHPHSPPENPRGIHGT